MNRWYVETPYTQGKEPMMIYGNSIEKVKKLCPEAISIIPCNDKSHLPYIKKIIEKSEFVGKGKNKIGTEQRELYRYRADGATVYIKLSKCLDDDEYYDIAQTQERDNGKCVIPITWELSTPKKTYEKYFTLDFSIQRIAYRKYGQPKLVKPKELKTKQTFSAAWNKSCKCPVYIQGNDVYMKHRDYFSGTFNPQPQDFGAPTQFLLDKYFNGGKKVKSFVYPDCWSSIILRDEAWLIFQGLIPLLKREENPLIGTPSFLVDKLMKSDDIARRHLQGYISFQEEWEIFFEQLIKECLNWMRNSTVEREEPTNV